MWAYCLVGSGDLFSVEATAETKFARPSLKDYFNDKVMIMKISNEKFLFFILLSVIAIIERRTLYVLFTGQADENVSFVNLRIDTSAVM